MSRSLSLSALTLLYVLALLASPAHADEYLDVREWLSRPGVKLLAVEFYASWCGPCKAAVPQWKALHEKYRNQGLRLIVVSVYDPHGTCEHPGWNPDAVICDSEGYLSHAWGVGDRLPAAFLWSWRGFLLVWKGHFEEVKRAVEDELARLPRVILDDQVPPELREPLRAELARMGKVDVVAGQEEERALAAIRKKSHELQFSELTACRLGERLAPNSLLKATVKRFGAAKKLFLQLFSAETGCLNASAAVFWNEERPDLSIAEAVAELVNSLRVPIETPGSTQSASQMVQQTIRNKTQEWQPEVSTPILVQFDSNPPGASVVIDGQLGCRSTPCSTSLPSGVHKIEMRKENYISRSESVKLSESNRWVAWILEPDFGWLTVLSDPPGIPVTVDGAVVGKTPLKRLECRRGFHQVTISDSRYMGETRQIQLDRGEDKVINVTLTPRVGLLEVKASDQDGSDLQADVLVDGSFFGRTPLVKNIIIGEHTVTLKASGRPEQEYTVTIMERQVTPVHAVLKAMHPSPSTGSLRESATRATLEPTGVHEEGSHSSVAFDISIAYGWTLNDFPETILGSLPVHLGLTFGNFEIAAYGDFGLVMSDLFEPRHKGGKSYTGIYGVSVRFWSRGPRIKYFLEAIGAYTHVSKRCVAWEPSDEECIEWDHWNQSGDDDGLGWGFRFGEWLEARRGLLPENIIATLFVNYHGALGWCLGASTGFRFKFL